MNQVAPSVRQLMKRGLAAMEKGRGTEAASLFQQVLQLKPDHVEALYSIGFMLQAGGNYPQATEFYKQAITADPTYFKSFVMLCKVLELQDRAEEAIQMAKYAVEIAPDEPQAHLQLISIMMRFNMVHAVPSYIEHILPKFPNHVELKQYQCFTLLINDQRERADALYKDLITKHRVPVSFRVMYETYLPRFYRTSDEIDVCRASFEKSVNTIIAENPRANIGLQSYLPVFSLAFHNRDNKELLKNYIRMLRIVVSETTYTAPHCKVRPVKHEGPIRIGFISKHMHNHSVGNCFRDMMIHMAKQPGIELTFFNLANIMDAQFQEIILAGVPVVSLSGAVSIAQQEIARHKLDIIVYPDIGMDATTHHLAMGRLAPYQICLNGHPETTGIDTIDYFVSSRLYEPDNAADNYTEHLLCFDGVESSFKRPPTPERWLTRDEIGLPPGKKVYVCPMAIQKIHPDFDDILADILARDPNAVIVLFNDFMQNASSELMQARILAKCDASRVIFAPWVSREGLFSVLKDADAVLDTVYFGGGTTIQYAFNFGIPVVTMPGRWTRGRVVNAYYTLMGIKDAPIAKDNADYAAVAVKLANDVEYQANLREQILANNHRLFDAQRDNDVMVKLMHDIMNQNLDAYKR